MIQLCQWGHHKTCATTTRCSSSTVLHGTSVLRRGQLLRRPTHAVAAAQALELLVVASAPHHARRPLGKTPAEVQGENDTISTEE